MKFQKILLSIVMTLFLSACSGAPSADDVQQALNRQIKTQIAQKRKQLSDLSGRAGSDMMDTMMDTMGMPKADEISVDNVQIQSSKELDNGDYKMRVSMEIRVKDQTRSKSGKLILHKTNDGWVVQDAG